MAELKVQYYTGRPITDETKAQLKQIVRQLEIKEVQIDLLLKHLKDSIK